MQTERKKKKTRSEGTKEAGNSTVILRRNRGTVTVAEENKAERNTRRIFPVENDFHLFTRNQIHFPKWRKRYRESRVESLNTGITHRSGLAPRGTAGFQAHRVATSKISVNP